MKEVQVIVKSDAIRENFVGVSIILPYEIKISEVMNMAHNPYNHAGIDQLYIVHDLGRTLNLKVNKNWTELDLRSALKLPVADNINNETFEVRQVAAAKVAKIEADILGKIRSFAKPTL